MEPLPAIGHRKNQHRHQLKPSLLNAALIAVILHLGVLNIFTFTFASKTTNRQPVFLFLGAILQKQDFEEMALTPQTTRIISQETDFLGQNTNPRLEPSSTGLEKPPITPRNLSKNQKQYLKTQFEEEIEMPLKENKPKADAALENTAPYVPLRSIFQ